MSTPQLVHGVRAGAAVAVMLALLVAGCAAPAPAADPPAAEASAQAPSALDLRQSGCEAITWSVPVTAASLRPHLPEGFEPSPPEGQQGLDAATTLGFRAVECAHGLGQEFELRSIQTGHLYTPVVPPAALREDRFGARYAFGWDVLAGPDEWRAAAAAWGLPLRDGGSLVGPGAQGWTGALAMDQVGSFTIAGRGLTPTATPPGAESRLITLGAQGFALWDTETANVTTSTGVGLWEASAGSWAAQVIGSQSGAAAFEYSTFDVPFGLVHWPGQGLSPVESPEAVVRTPDAGSPEIG